MMVEPHIEQAPWEDQARSDASLYLKQVEYLFDRSRFYREKLERAGFAAHGAVGGLEAIEGLPLTEKDELRRSRSPDEPIGAHRTASREEIVRIYSTSGTTGTPSYIPLTASDLDVWVRTSARSLTAPQGSCAASASSRPITLGPSSQAQRSAPSTGSASAIFLSGRETPSDSSPLSNFSSRPSSR